MMQGLIPGRDRRFIFSPNPPDWLWWGLRVYVFGRRGSGLNLSTYWLTGAKVRTERSHMSAAALCLHGACEGNILLSLTLPVNK
jgi:hypothetical protein